MKKLLTLTALSFAALLSACGERVEVPPAHVGKILNPNGYSPETITPSTFRLPVCWFWQACPKLVLLEVSDQGAKESFELLMPKDQLKMPFDIRMTVSVRDDPAAIDSAYNRVAVQKRDDGIFSGTSFIPLEKLYNVYGQPIIRTKARAVVSQYSINEVASSLEAISQVLQVTLDEALATTPLKIKTVAISNVQWPDVITRAKEASKEREIAIEQAENEKQVRLVQLEADLAAAQKERAVNREKAESVAEQNKIYADSVSESYINFKTLEVLEQMAKNENTVFVPMEAITNLGLQNRMFAKPQ